MQSGKARGPDLRLPEADVCIEYNLTWYRHLMEADQVTLCAVVRSAPVSRTVGRRGRVTLLLKNPDQPVREANLRGITISSHVSKLEPTAFYAVATAIYERALGGPCLVGGMRGISVQEVVRTVHMKLDLARLQHRIVDVLITDLAKFFDVIAQDIHPIVGARVGLGEADHLATHTEGFSYTLPLGPWQSHTLTQLLGTPQGTIQGVHAGATAALPFLRFMDMAYRSSAVEPFRFPGLMWVGDTIVLLERGDSRPIQGVLLDQRTYYQGILRVDVPDRKIQHGSTSDPRPLRLPTPAAVARHLGRTWVTSTPAGGIGRGPGNTTLRGPPVHGDGHLTSGRANCPPERAKGPGSALEAAPPPAALPGRRHNGTHGQAPEQAAPPGQRVPPHGQSTRGQRRSHD